uniref:Uncharacterized protein n=1 Tax=Anguilla anguilla TaxID=7936 RepID=A0A0E9T9Z7_ANGAN
MSHFPIHFLTFIMVPYVFTVSIFTSGNTIKLFIHSQYSTILKQHLR